MLIENSPHQGVPLHKHLYEDESFFVLSGIFEITMGGETTTGGPGTYAYGPRDVPHPMDEHGFGSRAVTQRLHARRHRQVLPGR